MFVTHDQAEAEFLAQRVIHLEGHPAAILRDQIPVKTSH